MSRPNSKSGRVVFGMPLGNIAPDLPRPLSSDGRQRPKSSGTKLRPKFILPGFNQPPKIPPTVDPTFERLKRKSINPAEGEDLQLIEELVQDLHAEDVTVQEFVSLIAPYTSDDGDILNLVMEEDLTAFKRMVKHVYDTMTHDIGDIFANEQVKVTEFYNQKYTSQTEKMMHTIDEIYRYVPNFSFELYSEDSKDYLNRLFPVNLDEESEEQTQCQEAYYKLQWLHSEGTRLKEENEKLVVQLQEINNCHQEEVANLKKKEEMTERRKCYLEATQTDLQNQLKELSESLEKAVAEKGQNLEFQDASNLSMISNEPDTTLSAPVKPPSESCNIEKTNAMNADSPSLPATSEDSIPVINSKIDKKKKVIKTKPKLKKNPDAKSPQMCNSLYGKSSHVPMTSARNYSRTPLMRMQAAKKFLGSRTGVQMNDISLDTHFTEKVSQNRNYGGRRNTPTKDIWGRF